MAEPTQGPGDDSQRSSPTEEAQDEGALDTGRGIVEVVGFARPGLTVYGNLLATLLFAITGMLYFLAGRTWFGIGWWVIGALWLRRYFWARRTPLLEIGEQDIRVHVGPYRVRPLPLAEIRSARLEDDKVHVELEDESSVKFSGFDLKKADMGRFLELLNRRRKDLPKAEIISRDEG